MDAILQSSGALESPTATASLTVATMAALLLLLRRLLGMLRLNMKNPMVSTYVIPPLVFAAMGGIGLVLKRVIGELVARVRKRFLTTLRMDSKDENYKAVVDFIGQQSTFVSSSMLVETYKKKNKTWKDWREEFMMGNQRKATMEYHPDNDGATSVFTYKGKKIWMHRIKVHRPPQRRCAHTTCVLDGDRGRRLRTCPNGHGDPRPFLFRHRQHRIVPAR